MSPFLFIFKISSLLEFPGFLTRSYANGPEKTIGSDRLKRSRINGFSMLETRRALKKCPLE